MSEEQKLTLGEILTVRTVPGREGKPIARLPDGRVVLFDKNSEYYDELDANMNVEGNVIVISENYVIINPTKKPEIVEPVMYTHYPEIAVDDIIEELEELIESVSGNASVIPKALVRILMLQQLIFRILTEES